MFDFAFIFHPDINLDLTISSVGMKKLFFVRYVMDGEDSVTLIQTCGHYTFPNQRPTDDLLFALS